MSNGNNGLDSSTKSKTPLLNPILFLGVIMAVSLLLRLYYFPYGVPLGLDALEYFSYAAKMSQIGQFPSGYDFPNNGWPTFLSMFFYFVHSPSFLGYMELQRYVSVALSLATIIPIYLLCRRFFADRYALLGAALFAFEPRLITNSLLGVTESLYLLLGVVTLFLFLGRGYKFVYASFVTCALFALVRYEGLILVIPLSAVFFIRFRREKKVLSRYLIAMLLFAIVLIPMAHIRIETTGHDGLTSHLFAGPSYISEVVIGDTPDYDDPIEIEEGESKLLHFVSKGPPALGKFVGLLLIPNLIILIGLGFYFLIKNRGLGAFDYKVMTIMVSGIAMLLPALYAYMRGIQEVRYLFIILPALYLISIYAVKRLDAKFDRFGIIAIVVLTSTLFGSIGFLEVQKIDYEHRKEAYLISEHIVKTPKVINMDPIDGNYITTAQVVKKWPAISSVPEFEVIRIPSSGFNSLEHFIADSKIHPTHIVVDGSDARPAYLSAVFYDDSKYPYLIKEYDSADHNLKYHVKIYRIDYDLFEDNNDDLR